MSADKTVGVSRGIYHRYKRATESEAPRLLRSLGTDGLRGLGGQGDEREMRTME